MNERDGRRAFFGVAGASALLVACRKETRPVPEPPAAETVRSPSPSPESGSEGAHDEAGPDEEVSAIEDLMREHGAIRRVLVVFREASAQLRGKRAVVPPDALHAAATLLRTFGEDYHERQLEEAHLFPAVRKAGGPAATEIDTLLAQHQRGREITDYVLAVTAKGIAAAAAEPLARALEGFARMYEEHAAREDTIVFPAWKKALSPKELDAMGELFEEIEKKTFGKDGFDDAVERIAAIERSLGLEPGGFMPAPPPRP